MEAADNRKECLINGGNGMYELIQVAKNTFYMDCPAKVGFYRTGDGEVVLIDSGSDRDAGKKVRKILDANGWKLKAVYNTHSHADHIGGNRYLQDQTGCKIYAPGVESCLTAYPVLEPVTLYGGFPMQELHNKFLLAKESTAELLTAETLPEGMELIGLPGHSFDMAGFRTADNVIFLADSLSSEETLSKYQIGFLYDVRSYLETLSMIKTLSADCFVPSHAPVVKDIIPLAQKNIDKTMEIAETIKGIVTEPKTFDEILREVFNTYGLTMTLQQNVLVGSTVKSYLAFLKDEGRAELFFEENRMLWKAV